MLTFELHTTPNLQLFKTKDIDLNQHQIQLQNIQIVLRWELLIFGSHVSKEHCYFLPTSSTPSWIFNAVVSPLKKNFGCRNPEGKADCMYSLWQFQTAR